MCRAFATGLAFSLFVGAYAACDRGAKEGEACFTSTAQSSDCEAGLSCAKCAEGNICVKIDGDDGRYLRVAGRQCQALRSVAEHHEIGRGVP